jgi:mRNA interferase HigB
VNYNITGPIPEMSMHVISRKKLREVWTLNPELEKPLRAWIKVAEEEKWRRFSDVRATLTRTDQVDKFTVFDILGNRYRLICVIHYNRGKVYIRHVLSHAEYDRGRWKRE